MPIRHSPGRLPAYFAGKMAQNEEKSHHDLTCEVAGTCGLRKNHQSMYYSIYRLGLEIIRLILFRTGHLCRDYLVQRRCSTRTSRYFLKSICPTRGCARLIAFTAFCVQSQVATIHRTRPSDCVYCILRPVTGKSGSVSHQETCLFPPS